MYTCLSGFIDSCESVEEAFFGRIRRAPCRIALQPGFFHTLPRRGSGAQLDFFSMSVWHVSLLEAFRREAFEAGSRELQLSFILVEGSCSGKRIVSSHAVLIQSESLSPVHCFRSWGLSGIASSPVGTGCSRALEGSL